MTATNDDILAELQAIRALLALTIPSGTVYSVTPADGRNLPANFQVFTASDDDTSDLPTRHVDAIFAAQSMHNMPPAI